MSYGIPLAGKQCPQCGMFHPPLLGGETCPMKKEKNEVVSASKTEIPGFVSFISTIRNTLITKIDKGEIKDPEKLLKKLTIAFVKFMEKHETIQ